VICTGIGFGLEKAIVDGEAPLRADGLTQAIRSMLVDAGCQMQDVDFRITDISGEQYYFKEAALALSRILRSRKSEFDLWHPAECTGEVGAASGATVIAAMVAAWNKQYAQGHRVMAHMANDAGQRAALMLQTAV
jgi:3-oxoacyl-[acyl-carrier-protein] synthase-1